MLKEIKDLFSSISNEEETLVKDYIFKGEMNSENFRKFKEILKKLIKEKLIKETSTISINSSNSIRLFDIDTIKSDFKENIIIDTVINKNTTKDNIIIFSVESITKNLKENLSNKSTLLASLNLFFKRETILIENNYEIINYVNNKEILNSYKDELAKTILFKTHDKLLISPHNIEIKEIISDESSIKKEFLKIVCSLKNLLSLIYLCSGIDINSSNKEIDLFFDGTKVKYFHIKSSEILNDFHKLEKLKKLFFWVYKEEDNSEKNQNFIEKLEIVRNLISITFLEEDNLNKLENKKFNILTKSNSNYMIYLKSKTKDYFELQFKVEEHVDKLFHNLGDELSKFSDFFRNNLYIFMGLLFSSVVIFILRNEMNKASDTTLIQTNILLNENLSTVIVFYGYFSLIVLLFTTIKFISNTKDLNNKLLGLKNKYQSFLDKDDLEGIIGDSFKKRKVKNYFMAGLIVLIWIVISFALIMNNKLLKIYFADKLTKKELINHQKEHEIKTFTIYYDTSSIDIKEKINNSNKDVQKKEIFKLNSFINKLNITKKYYIFITSNSSKEKITKNNMFSNNYQLSQARANNAKKYIVKKLLQRNYPLDHIKFDTFNRSNVDASMISHNDSRASKIEFYIE